MYVIKRLSAIYKSLLRFSLYHRFVLSSILYRPIFLTQYMHFKLLSGSVKHILAKVCVYESNMLCRSLAVLLEYDWFHLTGLIHDCGKVLALWDEPQVCYCMFNSVILTGNLFIKLCQY